MKRTIRKTTGIDLGRTANSELARLPNDDAASDDDLEIRFSLTALGELAVAAAGHKGRGRRFRGFGPCGAVA